jgi:uncharacterized protein (TIGR02452 family)
MVKVSKDTLAKLPGILKERPELDASASEFLSFNDIQYLDASLCPGYPSISVRVSNQDSFDASMEIAATPKKTRSNTNAPKHTTRPLVMNFASDKNPGGGWLSGAKAQEECLCYRSSLAQSLHKSHYPIPLHKFSYTRDVLIIRDAEFKLLTIPAASLPVVSCINIAALRRPSVNGEKYARDSDRDWMRKKMRVTLRLAAMKGHSRLVLGAFGCGAFKNPVEEVASLWKQVLGEDEFSGGWWEEIVFAVLWRDTPGQKGKGNFEPFKEQLNGMIINN